MNSNIGWDEQVVIRKHQGGPKVAKDNATLNQAMRDGTLSTDKKYAAGMNVAKNVMTDKNTARLAETTEAGKVATVNKSVARAIIDGRNAIKMSQKDLGTKINEKPQVVADYESGRAQPNNTVLGKLERALGIKLRGSNIGEQLAPRGSKAKEAEAKK